MLFRALLVSVLIGILTGCAPFSAKPTTHYSIELKEDHRLRFQGKGAGAGFMLSSSMGPMGIAIGVAIDEGISKDIQTAMTTEGFEIRTSLQNVVEAQRSDFKYSEGATVKISLDHYGFKTAPGDGDPVEPEIRGSIVYGDKIVPFEYPVAEEPEHFLVQFDVAKTDGTATVQAFNSALNTSIKRALQKLD